MSTHSHTHSSSGHPHGEHAHPHAHGSVSAPKGAAERKKDKGRLWLALVLTAGIAVAEGVGGYLANSVALMTDAVHMVTDVSALGLSLLAIWFASRPANAWKTYGYYRLEILSALANGVMLLFVTAWLAIEAYHRLRSPQPVHLTTMLGVAVVGLVSNLVSLSFLHRSESMNVRAAFLHILGDALSALGVIAAACLMMWRGGWLWMDGMMSLVISVVIVLSSVRLLRDAVDVLLESVPAHVDMPAILTLMRQVPGVVAVHDLHVWTISSGIYALSAHLVVPDPLRCNNDEILSAVKHELFERYKIDHTTIQIEGETFSHMGEVH